METMKAEYVDFFKNRSRIRSEIISIGKEIEERIEINKLNIDKLKVDVDSIA
jgi:hypothetical protein